MPRRALKERVAGLLMAGFEGTAIGSVPADLLGQLAGFILFSRNLQNAVQIRALTDGIRERSQPADAEGRGGEPLIAIDQEGGTVSRLAGIGTTTPSAMALGATGDPQATEAMYAIIGTELAALGINLDYAPVADVNNNPQNPVVGVRSFGENPTFVATHVSAAVRGLQRAHVAATAKHFPGHGDTSLDSHFDLPVIKHELERLRSVELVPFRAAINAGVDAIMTAHIVFPAFASQSTPATLSRSLLTDLLRNELAFAGVICTDCMEMGAIAATCAPERAAVMAVAAGADLVLFSHSPDKVRAAIAGLSNALHDGRLDADQVERSLERVAGLRAKLTRERPQPRETSREQLRLVGSEQHQNAALEAARRAVTVIRDPQGLLPLQLKAGERVFIVSFGADASTPVENSAAKERTALGKTFAALGVKVHEQTRSRDPAGHEYKQLLMASGAADAILAVTARAAEHPLQARALADLLMLGKRVVVITSREPYDAQILPPEMTVVAAFGDDPHALQASAEVIAGLAVARGTLPVTINGDTATRAQKTVQ